MWHVVLSYPILIDGDDESNRRESLTLELPESVWRHMMSLMSDWQWCIYGNGAELLSLRGIRGIGFASRNM